MVQTADAVEQPNPVGEKSPEDRPVFLLHAMDGDLAQQTVAALEEEGIPCYVREMSLTRGLMLYVPARCYHAACQRARVEPDEDLYREAMESRDVLTPEESAAFHALRPQAPSGDKKKITVKSVAAVLIALALGLFALKLSGLW